MAPQEELNLFKRDREPSSDTDSYYSTPNQSPKDNSLGNYMLLCMYVCIYIVYALFLWDVNLTEGKYKRNFAVYFC